VENSTFYRSLLHTHSSVWIDRVTRTTIDTSVDECSIAKKNAKWIVCVPQSCSLDRNVSRKDVENHIMRPLDAPGIFETLNGKKVVILGNKVRTKSGFRRDCTVRVLYTHDVESSIRGGRRFKLHVLFVNKPLEGGIDAPGESDELTPAMINKFMALFRSHSELEDVLASLERFTESVRKICTSGRASAVKPSLETCVRNAVCKTANVVAKSLSESASPRSMTMRRSQGFQQRMQQTLESYVMRTLHEEIFEISCDAAVETDKKLSRAIAMHRDVSKRALGVAPEFDCSTVAAERNLRSIGSCRTPLEQAQCIAETSRLIKASVEEHYRAKMRKNPKASYKEFATDDLLCIVIYVLTRCGNAHKLGGCFHYIEHFHFSSITTTAIGFHVAHFQVAAEWLIDELEKREAGDTGHSAKSAESSISAGDA